MAVGLDDDRDGPRRQVGPEQGDDVMSERYTKRDAEASFTRLAKALGHDVGHYRVLGDDLPPADEDAWISPNGSMCSQPGGWVLNHSYGGYKIEEMVSYGTGITEPFGSRRRTAREFCEVVWFTLRALEQQTTPSQRRARALK